MNTGGAAGAAFHSRLESGEGEVDIKGTGSAMGFARKGFNLRPQFKGADVCAITASGV